MKNLISKAVYAAFKFFFLPWDFDWKQYIENYPDLRYAGILTEREAVRHYWHYGRKEKRMYRAPANVSMPKGGILTFWSNYKWLHEVTQNTVSLKVSHAEPKRVNLFIESTDDWYAGYLSNYHLMLKLFERGHRIRCVLIAPSATGFREWRKRLGRLPGFDVFAKHVQLVTRFDERHPIPVSPKDRFIARSGWGAHAAHHATRKLGEERFIFITQDFEPLFYPHGSNYALTLNAYRFPQYTLFSTEFLRDFMRERHIGIFEREDTARNHLCFDNPIPRFNPDLVRTRHARRKKLLFYVRPQIERNLFELGFLALTRAIEEGVFLKGSWEFHGIGIQSTMKHYGRLPNGERLVIFPPVEYKEYLRILPQYDVGLGLMLSPHPSLVPLDMAAAGILTVTNTFENKTPEKLVGISRNLIPVEPSPEGVLNGFRQAVARTGDYEGRRRGMELNWPRTWGEVYDKTFLDRFESWLQ